MATRASGHLAGELHDQRDNVVETGVAKTILYNEIFVNGLRDCCSFIV